MMGGGARLSRLCSQIAGGVRRASRPVHCKSMRVRGSWAVAAAIVLFVAIAARGDARAVDPPAVLISRQLASARGLHAGDTIRLAPKPSGEGARAFRVAGIYEPEPDPMRFAQARLEARLHLPDLVALEADGAERPEAG